MKRPSSNIYLNSTSHGRSVGTNFITNLAAGLMVFVRGFCNYLRGKSDGRTLWVSSSVDRIIWDEDLSIRMIVKALIDRRVVAA